MFNFPSAKCDACGTCRRRFGISAAAGTARPINSTAGIPRAILYTFGKHLAGQANSGRLWYHLDVTAGEDELDGQVIRRQRTAPGLFAENEFLTRPASASRIEPGLGTQVGAGGASGRDAAHFR